MKFTRRGFIGACLGGGLAAWAINHAGYRDVSGSLDLSHTVVKIPNLHPALYSFRISLLSDLHLGAFVSNELIDEAIQLSNSFNPDLLILGGDYIGVPDSFPGVLFSNYRNKNFSGLKYQQLVPAIFETLGAQLKKATASEGIYAVLGNHDNWHNPDVCCTVLKGAPVRFLINEVVKVRRGEATVNLLGVNDLWTGVPRIPKDFSVSDPKTVNIIASHNPDFLIETIDNSSTRFDLGLCGHTHGGQIKVPGLGPIAGYNIRNSQFGEGLKRYKGSQIFTSRGVGVVDLPFRLGCPPEVATIELQPA